MIKKLLCVLFVALFAVGLAGCYDHSEPPPGGITMGVGI
jgi:hypothetical protein